MRIPLASTLKNRQADTDKDPRLLNCVVDSKKRVLKRPSLVGTYEVTTPGAGLGLFVRSTPGAPGVPAVPELIVIAGGTLETAPSVYIQNPTHTLVAELDPFTPNRYGFESGNMGSITPTTFNGVEISTLVSSDVGGGGRATVLGFASVQPSDFFTSIQIGGTTLLSADAIYSFGTWTWDGVDAIGVGTYKVVII